MENFPGNAHAARMAENKPPEPAKVETPSDEKQPVKKVVTGKLTKRGKPLGERMKDAFLNGGTNYVDHLIKTVVVPKAKDMALSIVEQMMDGIKEGFEDAIHGGRENNRSRRRPTSSHGNGPTRVAYHNMSSSRRRPEDRPPYRREPIRRSNQVDGVIVDDRERGELVIEELNAMIDDTGCCTVGDYYNFVDIVPNSTDDDWGWTDLKGARVNRLSADEFLITMPRPVSLR